MARDLKSRLATAKARLELAEVSLRLDRIKAAKKVTKVALSAYKAAERNRTNRDWRSPNISADAAIINDAPTMNPRARQMVRDDSYAQSIVRAFKRNVVGTGIHPSFQAANENGKTFDLYNRTAGNEWHDWSTRADLVDVEGRRTFIDIQAWALSEIITVGEAFIVWTYDQARHEQNGELGLVLRCVESDQLDTTPISYGGNEVRGGVEVDINGKAVAYHFWTRHPNDVAGTASSGNWNPSDRLSDTWDTREANEKGSYGNSYMQRSVRVPAEFVLHVYEPDRARQTRGVSRMASVLQRLRDVGQFEYAELLKARAQSCIGMAITSSLGNLDSYGLSNSSGEGASTDSDGNDEFAMQPIMTARLSPGESIQAFTPTSPGGQFTPFMMQELRAIAAGVGLSYEQVARDFTNGTYSSQRQSFLEDRREFVPLQNMLSAKLCQPIARQFVTWGTLEGRLPGANIPMAMRCYVDWRGQGWDWVDPANEADANDKALALGLETKQRILAEKGQDWREVAIQRAEESAFESSLSASSSSTEDTFNGAQVTSAVAVLIGVSAGTLSADTATEMLIQFFKLPPDTARRMVVAQQSVLQIPQDAAPVDSVEVAA